VMIRRSPLGTQKAGEALRMALGQSITNRVTVILVDAGVFLAGPLQPELVGGGEISKWLTKLLDMEQQVWVEAESLDRYGLERGLLQAGINIKERREIDRELLEADAVVVA
jgi:sulfur relay (sulfurtransferase) DsrF/TusC family protein